MKAEEIIKKIALSPECGGEYCKEGIECEECIDGLIKAIRSDERDKIRLVLQTEIDLLNASEMTNVNLYQFAVVIKQYIDKLGSER